MIKRILRRSQLISPYGVGAIVPFPNDESLIITGIDKWKNVENKFVIEDKRLIKRLQVNELRFPPDFFEYSYTASQEVNDFANRFIYSLRFPQWFYCPVCGNMKYYSLYHKSAKDITCDHENFKELFLKDGNTKIPSKKRMIPERFVVVCPEGHLMDFPIIEFLHNGTEYEKKEYKYEEYTIRRISGGDTASLSGIKYFCKETGVEKSLSGITQPGALTGIRFNGGIQNCCPGFRPWLGENYNENCNVTADKLRVVQRGGTNVWFAETRSSIYIPNNIMSDADRKVLEVAEEFFPILQNYLSNGKVDKVAIDAIAKSKNVDPSELYECVNNMMTNISQPDIVTNEDDEDAYRKFEYDAISKTFGSDKHDLYVINKPITDYNSSIATFFKSVSLVYKLRETRAFVGFSRLETQKDKSIDEMKRQLTKDGVTSWLPAVQYSGEGIFIEFSKELITNWKKNNLISERANKILNNYNSNIFKTSSKMQHLNEEYILIHTFSHILINELSKKCGYGSSSLRERLYVSRENNQDMLGVMIYTSSGDSEGSLGGLVREGLPGRLEESIFNAMIEAEWCSADPFCINSSGQGTNSCNLAACHNCALLPETCCEVGNKFLDRAMLIGTIEHKEIGYFSPLLDEIENER